ncbi:MAG TPA: BMP family ABC transporter substrate-binding protein [Candidatus Limnocylindrales bacterium]|nr:BMP family ABC transporter substrate-binding protein [Candidatus Limnocylindrales bacterium]
MNKRSWFTGVVIVLLFSVLSTFGLKVQAQDKLKVAFIYVSPVGDFGWSYAHDQGRKYLEKTLNYVETAYTESVAPPDVERVIRDYAQKGYKVIFTTSFEFMDPTLEVARDFPDTIFEHCSGYKTAKNVGTYFGRIHEAAYLSGLVAGKMTRKNRLGFVAAHPIPEVIRNINSFTKGVREVNPQATVKVVWTGSWYDPPKEKEAALSLIEAGADVIAQHQDSPAALEAAKEKQVYSVGYNNDMSQFNPEGFLTAPVWNWGPFYVEVVKSVKEGTWKSESYWKGFEAGIIDIAPYGKAVPQEIRDFVDKRKQEIKEGKFKVWPDKSDEELLKMNYFIEGVEGQIPK